MHRHSCALQELLEATSGPLSLLGPWLGALALDPQRTLGRVTARTARPAEAAALLRTLAQVQCLHLGFGSMLLCMQQSLPSRQCTAACDRHVCVQVSHALRRCSPTFMCV
jgi:hypothetical protein